MTRLEELQHRISLIFELNFSMVLLRACWASLVNLSASVMTATRHIQRSRENRQALRTFKRAPQFVHLLRLGNVLDYVLNNNAIVDSGIAGVNLDMMVA